MVHPRGSLDIINPTIAIIHQFGSFYMIDRDESESLSFELVEPMLIQFLILSNDLDHLDTF